MHAAAVVDPPWPLGTQQRGDERVRLARRPWQRPRTPAGVRALAVVVARDRIQNGDMHTLTLAADIQGGGQGDAPGVAGERAPWRNRHATGTTRAATTLV